MKNVLAAAAATAALLLAGCASSADDQAGSAPAISGAAVKTESQGEAFATGFTFAGIETSISGCAVDEAELNYDLTDVTVSGAAELVKVGPTNELGLKLSCDLVLMPTAEGKATVSYTATEYASGAPEQRNIVLHVAPAPEGGGVPAVDIPTMVSAGESISTLWDDRDWRFEFGKTTARSYPHLKETSIETELKIAPPEFSGPRELLFPETGAGYAGAGDVLETEHGCAAVLSGWSQQRSCLIAADFTSPEEFSGPQFAWFTVGGNTFAASVAETAKAPVE